MDESEFPDPPQTPAPIFAFRALKGFFLGSPDDEVENKENNPVSSPTIANDATPPPQKRRRGAEYSSPVKSILRPSGVATPRVLQLRKENVAVAFRDVRKSVSPEAKMRAGEMIGVSVEENIVTKDMGSLPGKVQGMATLEPNTRVAEVSRQDPVSQGAGVKSVVRRNTYVPTVQSLPPFDVEAYKRSTEREMRKLVKYGQRMREYARMQEGESAKLRQTIKLLKKENVRLQRESDERKIVQLPVQSAGLNVKLADDPEKDLPLPVPKQTDQHVRVDGSGRDSIPKKARTAVVELCLSDLPVAPINRTSHQISTTASKLSAEITKAAVTHTEAANELGIPLPKNPGLEPTGTKETNQQPSMQIAPDRLAAARERIRAKAEKRKACEMDKSVVDWNDL